MKCFQLCFLLSAQRYDLDSFYTNLFHLVPIIFLHKSSIYSSAQPSIHPDTSSFSASLLIAFFHTSHYHLFIIINLVTPINTAQIVYLSLKCFHFLLPLTYCFRNVCSNNQNLRSFFTIHNDMSVFHVFINYTMKNEILLEVFSLCTVVTILHFM
jgi:hypothetical protein